MSLKSLLCVGLIAAVAPAAAADRPSLLKMFGRRSVEADRSKDYILSEEDGPWLILASTFVGKDAKQRAERLVLEIRRDLNLPAFRYQEKFDFTGNVDQKNQLAKQMRYANQYEYEAYAVLVGEYDTVEHPDLENDLQTLKSATPDVFRDPDAASAETDPINPVTAVKALHRKLIESRDDEAKGPMVNAFVTRNPMLPDEYFQAPQVDSFVHSLNEDKEFSLLECEGKYTVVVRTFEGYGTVVDGKQEKDFEPSIERLDRFAADAAKMVKALRRKGEEAYQFHDRHSSRVTVGSFDNLGRELPDGRFVYAPEIRKVMEKYRAFNSKKARRVPGKQGVAANHAAMIPFDVKPTPVAVPRVSKRSLYSSALEIW